MSELGIATYNLYVKAAKNHPDKVEADLAHLLENYHAIGIQEAGSSTAHRLLIKVAARHNARVWFGDGGKGQSSTPVLFRNELHFLHAKAYPLTRSLFVGDKGAGPRTLKNKWLMTVTFLFDGRLVTVGNLHAAPSQYIPIRGRLAHKQFAGAGHWMHQIKGLKFVVGDFNQVAGKPQLNSLEAANMVSSQIEGGIKGTHGKRAIDDVYHVNRNRSRNLVLVSTEAIPGASDHDAFGAKFEVRPYTP